ncbi:MAG TPA: hypothetical protein VMP11_03090 [Verrucomicrobiae bacterium]|nr:hypothetical protein [Verrucomicrobiae bacterium]
MNGTFLLKNLSGDISKSHILDALIILGLSLVALFAFYVTPDFAANLPQDGVDFAVPAVNLLERGCFADTAYGHEFPPAHPFGMALLLIPAYSLTGHFLGNGIYAVLLCALGTIALTYIIGMRMSGRTGGCLAALFLITNYGFWQYSQKIMSEVPSVFLGVVVMTLALAVGNRERSGLICFAIGLVLGLATTVRYDNVLLLIPALPLLLTAECPWPARTRNVLLCLAGIVPFVGALAAYNQEVFGSAERTGYGVWGNSGAKAEPLFAVSYVTKPGFMSLRGINQQFAQYVEGNGTFYVKSLLSESDTTRIFGPRHYWQLPGRTLYQTLALIRTFLGVIGLLTCVVVWKSNSCRRQFFVWVVVLTVVYTSFYLVYSWQEERFLMRLVPGFCLANAIGITALLARCHGRTLRFAVVTVVGGLIVAFAFYNWQMGFPSGNDLHLYETLTSASRRMEPNAIVVSNFERFRLDAYVIRGTERMAVPLTAKEGAYAHLGGNNIQTPFHPFIAVESPERLRELVRKQRPVYWLVNDPWSGEPRQALDFLERSFRLQVLATASVDGGPDQPYFGRIYERP